MKLTGTARGRNIDELMIDAHRQAKLFFGNQKFELSIGTPRADNEYNYYSDGRIEVIRTAFDMDFTAESPITIQEGQ